MRGRARRQAGIIAGVVAVAVAIGAVWHRALAPSLPDRFRDLQAYRIAGHLVGHAPSLLYTFKTAHGAPFTYPPAAAWMLTPFTHMSLTTAGVLLGCLSLMCGAVVLLTVARSAEVPVAVHGGWLLVLGAGLTYALPWRNTVSLGQIDALLLLLVVTDLLVVTPRWRGVLIGIAAAIKVTPVLFVPYLWLRGSRRAAATSALSFVTVGAVAWALLPGPSHTFWLHALWNTHRVGAMDDPRNRSLPGALVSVGLPRTVALGVAVAFAAWVVWRAASRAGDAAGVAAMGCTSALITPITWSHHLVWIAPAFVAVGAVGARGRWLAIVPLLGFYDWPGESLRLTSYVQLALTVALVLWLLSAQRTMRIVPPPVLASSSPAVPSPT